MALSTLTLVTHYIVLCYAVSNKYDGHELLVLNIITTEHAELADRLRQQFQDLDFWSAPVPGVECTVLAPRHRVPEVKSRATHGGLGYRVVSTDVQSLVDRSYVRPPHAERRTQGGDYDVIGHDQYHTLEEIQQSLSNLTYEYPDNMEVEYIGNETFEGRRLMLVKAHTPASAEKQKDVQKPVIVMEFGVHAREWISPATALFFLEKLLKDYTNNDVTARHMLDTFDWYLLPVVNPDGYHYTWTTDRLWRKNRHVQHCNNTWTSCHTEGGDETSCHENRWCVDLDNKPGNTSCSEMYAGVDINRNFDVHFGEAGVSSNCHSNTWPGDYAFSEVESRTIRDLILEMEAEMTQLAAYVSVHAHSQLLMVPWFSDGTKSANNKELTRVGRLMTKAMYDTHWLKYRFGTAKETIGYVASGTSCDWVHVIKPTAYNYAFELRPRGWPGVLLDSSEIVPQGEEFFAAIAAMSGVEFGVMEGGSLVFRVCSIIIATTTIVFNIPVLVAIWNNKHLHTPSNVFIAHLSAADIFVAAIVTPLSLLESLMIEIDFYPCVLLNSLHGMYNNLSVVMLLSVALEKFVAIRFPFVYCKHIDVEKNMYYAAIAWVVGFTVGLVPLFGWHTDIDNYGGKCQYTAVIPRSYMVYIGGLIMFLIPMVMMTCIYTYIWRVAKRHQRRETDLNLRFKKLLKEDRRAKNPFVKICLCFFFFRLPLVSYDLMKFYECDHHWDKTMSYNFLISSVLLSRVKSSINPFIYAGSNKQIRAAVLNIVFCRPQAPEIENVIPVVKEASPPGTTPTNGQVPTITDDISTHVDSEVTLPTKASAHFQTATSNNLLHSKSSTEQVYLTFDYTYESSESLAPINNSKTKHASKCSNFSQASKCSNISQASKYSNLSKRSLSYLLMKD